jgi:hypothetical protein
VNAATQRLERALARLPSAVREAHVADAAVLHLPGNVPPWTSAELELEKGDAFTLFAEGRVVLSEEAGLWNGPAFHLWARVGGRGPLHNGARDTASFRAPHAGPLELCVYSGEWGTRDGELATPLEGYALLSGGIDVLAVRWKGDARSGVEALADAVPDEPLFAAELERLRDPGAIPEGWHHLWFLGESDIFRPTRGFDGRQAIRVHTHDDVGILQHPVDLPLGPDARIGWHWKVETLPSARPEDTLPTHDYLSIAAEFDNGQDLTWTWSSQLPPGTHYRCPLPQWDQRETHWVVRSGEAGLGQWQAEERRLRADYAAAVGEVPARIVAVWLIAVSIFQKGDGSAEFADVWIESGGRRVQIL